MSVLLEARHVTKVFAGSVFFERPTIALQDFSLTIDTERPSVTAVVGESGSGKTTMARLLLGLETPSQGEVLYKGKNLRELRRNEWHDFRRDVQVVFQDPFEVYNPFYKVDHVLATPIAKFSLASGPGERRRQMQDILRAVGLRPEEILGRYPHQLSGGQRQRIMVARALLLKPKLIVADEPVSMIDASLRATVLANLQQLNLEYGISVIYITHDLTTAYQISDNIIVMYSGSVTEAGEVGSVVLDPQHPYTQLLIGSVPPLDPDTHWKADALESAPEIKERGETYCKFVDRCPHAMPKCTERAPGLYQISPHRVSACYLHEAAPAIRPEDMTAAFIQPANIRG